MIRHKRWIEGVLLLPIILLFINMGTLFAQTSENYKIKKSVIDNGGVQSQSANNQLVDAVGQSSEVGTAVSENHSVSSGFFGDYKYSPTGVVEKSGAVQPEEFKLHQNYPNPFNPETSIEFQLPFISEVVLTIYNLQGHIVQRLVHTTISAGSHTVQWNGQNEAGRLAASGIYFYQIEIKPQESGQQSYVDIRKMLFLK